MKDIFNIENFNIIEDEENFDTSKAKLKKGIVYRAPTARISSYKALNNKQSLEKNKIIAKLTILERVGGMTPIIPHTANNNLLVQTIGRAFSSLELIHYGEIEKEEIIEIPKEIVDIFALLQQQEGKNNQIMTDLKREVIRLVKEETDLVEKIRKLTTEEQFEIVENGGEINE